MWLASECKLYKDFSKSLLSYMALYTKVSSL